MARAFLWPDGRLAALKDEPLLPGTGAVPTLSAPAQASLGARVAALRVSGLVETAPEDYRVTLLAGNVPVATLRLDRRTLAVLPEPKPKLPAPPRTPGPRP